MLEIEVKAHVQNDQRRVEQRWQQAHKRHPPPAPRVIKHARGDEAQHHPRQQRLRQIQRRGGRHDEPRRRATPLHLIVKRDLAPIDEQVATLLALFRTP